MSQEYKIGFGTVVYPEAIRFTEDFCRSLSEQSTENYTLIIISEGVENDFFENSLPSERINTIILRSPVGESVVGHRVRMIKEAKNRGFDLLIIGDYDDWFSADRIEKTVRLFSLFPTSTFFYNALLDENKEECMPVLPEIVTDVRDILEKNYLGMSNTAINLNRLSEEFIISLEEFEGVAFDWYLFSRILLAGGIGRLVKNTFTVYRLHEGNVAGVRSCSKDNLLYELKIKKQHYGSLVKYDGIYKKLKEKYDAINIDNTDYQFINDDRRHYWWDLIRLEEGYEQFCS